MQPCNVNCMMLELLHTVLESSMCPTALNTPQVCLDRNSRTCTWNFKSFVLGGQICHDSEASGRRIVLQTKAAMLCSPSCNWHRSEVKCNSKTLIKSKDQAAV